VNVTLAFEMGLHSSVTFALTFTFSIPFRNNFPFNGSKNSTFKSIALQIVSGREGISLRQAEYLVYYNIDFSATSYWQSKDRMTTKDRLHNKVYWIFSKGGIEKDIYKAVTKKKDYTIAHFKKSLCTDL
jgi:hypothetical protein